MDTELLARRLREFAADRDWDQFHTPKNLAISISTEASELLELFQWSRGTFDWSDLEDQGFRRRVEEEVADVFLYLLRFADRAGIDVQQAAMRKLAANAVKYPADKFKGSDRKYNED